MKSAVSSIRVGARHRKEMGDLQSLADSIAAEGLLQPIGVTEGMDLVFGERRLRAVRDILKRDEIDIRIVKVSSIVAGEMAENEIRKDFTPSERIAIAEAVRSDLGERRGRPTLEKKVGNGAPFSDPSEADKVAEGKTRDLAAKLAGFGSARQLERAENVVKLGVPKLVAKMDAGEVSISAAATIAKAAPSVQEVVVALPSAEQREAVTKLKEDTERARQVAEEQEKRTGPTAFTGFMKKNGRYPDAAEAETIAKLDYRATPDAEGKRHSPVAPPTKEQKAADRAHKKLRDEVWRMLQAIQLLSSNEADPALVRGAVFKVVEGEIVDEHLDKASRWLSSFSKEWKNHGK